MKQRHREENTHKVEYRSYSEDVLGYIVAIPQGGELHRHFIINDNIDPGLMVDVYATLKRIAGEYADCGFILLMADGQLYYSKREYRVDDEQGKVLFTEWNDNSKVINLQFQRYKKKGLIKRGGNDDGALYRN